jgi:hypothetical protein
LTFHFEGALADSHRMNFYEAARFQYAAARLMVKLAQFRQAGNFNKKITNRTNFNIQLQSQSSGSFNINIEDFSEKKEGDKKPFLDVSLSDLVSFISERVIDKVDEHARQNITLPANSTLPGLVSGSIDSKNAMNILVSLVKDKSLNIEDFPRELRELVKRIIAEDNREAGLSKNIENISKIDFQKSQKLLGMAAPLFQEMAIPLRKSADTLEISTVKNGQHKTIVFLDRKMASEIETALVDKESTAILGDIIQFNKDNGWGKIKFEDGTKIVSFNIPYDILPRLKTDLVISMNRDLVYLEVFFVRDQAGEVTRMLVTGILPTPQK